MFFEQCGRLFFGKIRPFFFFFALSLPFVFTSWFLFLEYTQLQSLQERGINASKKQKIAFERKGRKETFLKRYTHTDPYFLNQSIEALPLLQSEKQKIESLLHHPAFPESQLLQERLSFLDRNRLSFAEDNIRVSSRIKETDEKQRYPVQLDENDLHLLLALIEHIPLKHFEPSLKSPQLLIKNFQLQKHKTPLQTDVFELEMDLLKREFSQ